MAIIIRFLSNNFQRIRNDFLFAQFVILRRICVDLFCKTRQYRKKNRRKKINILLPDFMVARKNLLSSKLNKYGMHTIFGHSLPALSSQLSPVIVVKCLIHSEQMMCFASMRFPFLWVESTTDSILSSIFVRNLQSTAMPDATNIHTSRSQLNVDTSPVIDDHSQNDFINNNGFFIGLWSNFTLKMYIGWLWPVTIFDQRVELVSF